MGSSANLLVTISAQDFATKALQSLQGELSKTEQKTAAMGGTASKMGTLLPIAAIIAFGASSVKAFADAETSQMKLQEAFRKFPALADTSLGALRDLNSELQLKTKYDDDATAAMQAQLAMFKLTGQQIASLTPLVQDLATAKGVDLTTAASAVGKALLGNAKGLKDVGIEFKATGDRAADYDAIMGLLRTQVGGFATAEGKTAAGQLAILNNQFGDLQESVGQTLMPVLQSLVSVMTPVVKTFANLPGPVRNVALGITVLGGAFLFLAPKIAAAKAAMSGFGDGALRLGDKALGNTGKIKALAGAMTIAVAAFAIWKQGSDNADQAAQSLADTLDKTTGAATALTKVQIGQEFLKNFNADDLAQMPFTLREVVDAAASGGAAYDAFMEKVKAWHDSQSAWDKQSYTEAGRRYAAFLSSMDAANRDTTAAKALVDATRASGDAAGVATDQIDGLTGATDTSTMSVKDAIAAYKGMPPILNETTLKADALAGAMGRLSDNQNRIQALQGFKQAVDDFVKKPSADAAMSVVSAFESAYGAFKDGSLAQANFVAKNYDTMKKTIENSGLSASAKRQLLTPLDDANQKALILKGTLGTLKSIDISVLVRYKTAGELGGGIDHNPATPYATGGLVRGPGSKTSDSVPARLSRGEFVVQAAAVDKLGIPFLEMLNTGRAYGMKKGGKNPHPGYTNAQYAANNANGWAANVALSRDPQARYETMMANQQAADDAAQRANEALLDAIDRQTQAQQDAAEAAAKAAQDAADAAQQAARAEADRLEELHRQQQALISQARQLLENAGQTRDDYAKTVASASIGYGSISGWQATTGGTVDTNALTFRAPGTDGAGDGGPVSDQSSNSISGYMQGRLDRVRKFGQVIKALNVAGLNQSTLKEIVAAGPDAGTTIGQALLDAGVDEIGKVNTVQTALEDRSSAIGAYTGNAFYGQAVTDQFGNYSNVVGSNGGTDDMGNVTVQLVLDSQIVATQLLALKRAKGGVSLGLD